MVLLIYARRSLDMADLLFLLCVEFAGVFVTLAYGVPGQVWHLIVLINDLLPPLYF